MCEKEGELSISVLIPTYKRMDILPICLNGITNMTGNIIQVVVVFRPDDDPETAMWLSERASEDDRIDTVGVYTPGVVAALNAGLEKVHGDLVVIFDDDAVPRMDWLTKVYAHFDNPAVAAVGGRDIVYKLGEPVKGKMVSTPGVIGFWGGITTGHHLVVGEHREVDVLKGCNWSLRKVSLGSLRFDERLLGTGAQYANEAWFCLNLRHRGWKIILDPNAIVDHYEAHKPDYERDSFSRLKCFEWTANKTATELAYASPIQCVKYILFKVLVGTRHCPGFYFLAHSVVKRPRLMCDILIGGWSGFIKGVLMAREFRRFPPGYSNENEF